MLSKMFTTNGIYTTNFIYNLSDIFNGRSNNDSPYESAFGIPSKAESCIIQAIPILERMRYNRDKFNKILLSLVG